MCGNEQIFTNILPFPPQKYFLTTLLWLFHPLIRSALESRAPLFGNNTSSESGYACRRGSCSLRLSIPREECVHNSSLSYAAGYGGPWLRSQDSACWTRRVMARQPGWNCEMLSQKGIINSWICISKIDHREAEYLSNTQEDLSSLGFIVYTGFQKLGWNVAGRLTVLLECSVHMW